MDLNNNLSQSQAAKQLSRRVLPEDSKAGVIKATTQKVQATTSDRTNVSLGQQFCWHCIVDEEYNLLRTSNTGLCKRSGKSFGEVVGHFIAGLNEMCLMSDAHGDLRVFGSADKKKHEKLLQDSRVSITVVRTGTVAGNTGPTIFLLKGTKKRAFFTNNFFMRHGMAIGLAIVMTENAYMTEDAWVEASYSIVKGYCSMPFVADNPDWSMVELLDGFKSYKNVLSANELRSDHNIRLLKEESNLSHLNQGYDQLTAKCDKKNAVESLYDQRRVQKWRSNQVNIDQYDLIFTAMRIVWQCKPETWISLFRRVNLDPIVRLSFQDWCKKIAPYLLVGEVCAEENVDPTPQQLFNLLPSFWHGMQPANSRVVTTIMGSHGWRFTPYCINQIHLDCNLLYSQMNDLQICLLIT
jgi:hypothetical protein